MPPGVEQFVYQDPPSGVTVTTARLVIGAAMYPVRGITAVQLVAYPPDKSSANRWAWGALLALVSIPLTAFLGVAAAVGCFIVALLKLRGAKSPHAVRIFTAGGQIDAYVTTDHARAQALTQALHRAVAGV